MGQPQKSQVEFEGNVRVRPACAVAVRDNLKIIVTTSEQCAGITTSECLTPASWHHRHQLDFRHAMAADRIR